MPTYRRPVMLRQALTSATGQTYRNLQIVVRDNCSGDETPDVVRSFTDTRIEFHQAARNEGPSRNGIECLRRARGKYLIYLSDDDFLGENYVATLVGLMEQDPAIVAAYGATCAIDDGGKVTGQRVPDGTCKWGALEIIQAWKTGSLPLFTGFNYLCRASFLASLRDMMSFPEGHHTDNLVFMTAGIRGKVLFTDQCVFYYRFHLSNTERRLSCQARAVGDRLFLRYLDVEVKSPLNLNLPRADWPRIRLELQSMLCDWYFYYFLKYRLESDGAFRNFKNALVYSARTYGWRNTRRLLAKNRQALRAELWKHVPLPLKRVWRKMRSFGFR